MTHSQILQELPRPDTIEDSDCPGELRLSEFLDRPRAGVLLVCKDCNWSLVVRNRKDAYWVIHNAFPAPVIPDHE
jgi:hypothetical protein